MKFEHLTAKISSVCGTYTGTVTLPDDTKGQIRFTFEYSPEYGHISIDSGELRIGTSASVTFCKTVTRYTTTEHGRIPEDWNTPQLIMDYIADLQEKLANAQIDVKLNFLGK